MALAVCSPLVLSCQGIVTVHTSPGCAHLDDGIIEISIDPAALDPEMLLPYEADFENKTFGIFQEFTVYDYSFGLENMPGGTYDFVVYLDDFCHLSFSAELDAIPTNDLEIYGLIQYPQCDGGLGTIFLLPPLNGSPARRVF